MTTATTGLGGDNTLTGTDGGEKIVAGGDNDIIDGGAGSDFINAGGGNDTIVYDELDYKILGGGGVDTLWFTGSGQSLNLGWNFVSGIERLLLDGGGRHRVTFTAADIVRVSDTDRMIITGDETNVIDPGTGWTFAGLTADGQSQILQNGLARLVVALPVIVDGFSKNAEIDVSSPDELQEDGLLETAGIITIEDQNAGQAQLIGEAIPEGTPAGGLTITLATPWSTGGPAVYQYSYIISNNSVQYLGAGDTLSESFTIRTLDGSTQTLPFTTIGKNDPASIGVPGEDERTATEDDNPDDDGHLQISGTLTVSDADQGESRFMTTVISAANNLGTLSLSPDGTYTYSVKKSAVQYLKSGTWKTESFEVRSLDGTTQSITFAIEGVDDLMVIGTPTKTTLKEDHNFGRDRLYAIGNLPIIEPEWEDRQSIVLTASGEVLGSFSLSPASGDYVYTIENRDVQYLISGETMQERYVLTANDGIEAEIVFSIEGVDDKAVITIPAISALTEDKDVTDGDLVSTGKLTVSDPDKEQAIFQTTPTPGAANLGTLVLDNQGNFVYSIKNSAVDYLKAGEYRDESFTVRSADGTSATVTFRINGADDGIRGTPDPDNDLKGTDGNDQIFGLAGDDTIFGLGGNDRIDGGSGNDQMSGGTGDDYFIIDSSSDSVVEKIGEGTDTVESSVSLTLANNVENLTLTGASNINGSGNSLANVINGNSGDNTISAGAGNDQMDGFGGLDYINGGDGDDTIICGPDQAGAASGDAGNDIIKFYASAETLTLQGLAGSDTFILMSSHTTHDSGVVIAGIDVLTAANAGGDILDLPDPPYFYTSKASTAAAEGTAIVGPDGFVLLILLGVSHTPTLLTDLANSGHLI